MAGFVYVMSNPAFTGLLKIGQTNKDPEVYRKEELDTTGVPAPFKVEYYVFSDNYINLELKVHSALSEYRPINHKEFFECSIPIAIKKIRELGKDTIKYEQLNYVFPRKSKPKPKRKPKLIDRRDEESLEEFDARVKREYLEEIIKAKRIRRGKKIVKLKKGKKETLKAFDARVKSAYLEEIKIAKENRKEKTYVPPKKKKTISKTQHVHIEAKQSDIKAKQSNNGNWAGFGLLVVAAIAIYYFLS